MSLIKITREIDARQSPLNELTTFDCTVCNPIRFVSCKQSTVFEYIVHLYSVRRRIRRVQVALTRQIVGKHFVITVHRNQCRHVFENVKDPRAQATLIVSTKCIET